MKTPESASGRAKALTWKTYSVRRADKIPLLNFVIEGLEQQRCRIIFKSEPDEAPFYIVFETPAGDRQGVLVYAFFANAKPTRNRPDDEHRFQVKYGGELRGVLEIAVDPHSLITTIFLGIDPERDIFIAADPLMNNPSPMSRSIEFKSKNVEEILDRGWAAWERDYRQPKTRSRPTPDFDADKRIQVLVGGRKDRIFDLIQLEQMALGFDPGERHLIADKLLEKGKASLAANRLLHELNMPSADLLNLIDRTGRLKMAVRGWVAESHLETLLKGIPGVTECRRIEEEGKPDISLRWRGSAPILVECKNVLRKQTSAGLVKVDFQRTRASKADPCSRYYRPGDFKVLAACLHPVSETWNFVYAMTSELPPHQKCVGRISNNLVVQEPIFISKPELVFEKACGRSSAETK
ncbi:hypothetical protein [Pseudolabrys sp. FHR47]|uniref:hypothetical protein n=1 Tax=Pseudolabrys sp. FHR47 TaxID=2562284 RepID=UPI0010BE7AE1|nr:hypothetical protein [Pseudolabrys sp. FHR47]